MNLFNFVQKTKGTVEKVKQTIKGWFFKIIPQKEVEAVLSREASGVDAEKEIEKLTFNAASSSAPLLEEVVVDEAVSGQPDAHSINGEDDKACKHEADSTVTQKTAHTQEPAQLVAHSDQQIYELMSEAIKTYLDDNSFLSLAVLRPIVEKSISGLINVPFNQVLFERALKRIDFGYQKVPPQNKRFDNDNLINDNVYYSEEWLNSLENHDVISRIKEQIVADIRSLRSDYGTDLNIDSQLRAAMWAEHDARFNVVAHENYYDLILATGELPCPEGLSAEDECAW